MGRTYEDPRYGVEKVLTFPGHRDLVAAAGNISQIPFTEDIVITEFGIVITEAVTGAGALATVQLREDSVVLASISVPSASAIGVVVTASALTASNINKGDTLIFYGNATCLTVGECDGYIRYKERYVSG